MLTLKDGTTLYFPYTAGATSAVQAALKAVQDRNGNYLQLKHYSGYTTITAAGATVTLTYDASGRVTQASDNLNRAVAYTYDASGRLWQVRDANQGLTQYIYDTSNRMTQIIDPRTITYLTNQYDRTTGSPSRRWRIREPTCSPTPRAPTAMSSKPT